MDKTKIHIVHSVKGGCGKTTFSLFKSIRLSTEYVDEGLGRDQKNRVLYIDCDFRGSALKVYLFGPDLNPKFLEHINSDEFTWLKIGSDDYNNCKKKLEFQLPCSEMTLNDFINQSSKAGIGVDDILVHGSVYVSEEERNKGLDNSAGLSRSKPYAKVGKIDFIFSPPKSEDKKIFGQGVSHGNEDVVLNKAIFRLRMRNLLEQIITYGKMNESSNVQYTDIILDMPPGSDEYADALLKEVNQIVVKNKEIEAVYYVMTTTDRGHMYATADYIISLLNHHLFDEAIKICCVFTEMFKDELGETLSKLSELSKEAAGILFNRIAELKGTKDIEYYINRYSEEFYETTHLVGYNEALEIKDDIIRLKRVGNEFAKDNP